MNAAAYIRVSTEEQLEYSPDSQLKKIREYAAQHTLEIRDLDVFVDEGISGRNAEKRPAFLKMIQAAKEKPRRFACILVWKFSRFARNRADSIFYKSMLRKDCGVEVISVSEPLGTDKSALLVEALLEAMDEYYSLNLAEEVRRGMQEKFARGGVISQPPFGYRMGQQVFVPQETEAAVVQFLFAQYLRGTSCRQLALLLNAAGIRTTRGNAFAARTVEYILTNPVYTGKLRRSPEGKRTQDRYHQAPDTLLVSGGHVPLVSEQTFAAALARHAAHKEIPTAVAQTTEAWMLRGLLRCSACGATLVRSTRRGNVQCCRYARGQCGTSHSISLSKLEPVVLRQLGADLCGGEIRIALPQTTLPAQEHYATLLAAADRKLERIVTAYTAGIDTLEEYRAKKTAAELELELLRQHARAEPEKRAIVLRTEELLRLLAAPGLSESEKNAFLHCMIAEIRLFRAKNQIQIMYHSSYPAAIGTSEL